MKESTENSLYNFKTKKKYFLELLKSFRFTPRYNKEFVWLNKSTDRPAVDIVTPMVCWCDIPLKRIRNHTQRYGEYGIGISKNWARQNLINPVIYVIEDTMIAKAHSSMTNSFIELSDLMNKDLVLKNKISHITGPLFFAANILTQYLKPYEYQGLPTKQENRKFYDEKEWRYVPDPIDPFTNLTIFPSRYADKESLEKAIEEGNRKIESRFLFFEPDDITIIIVPDQNDKNEIFECIQKTCMEKGYTENIESIKNKIKTLQEIEED